MAIIPVNTTPLIASVYGQLSEKCGAKFVDGLIPSGLVEFGV